jgi:folate-binding protein YgfZ
VTSDPSVIDDHARDHVIVTGPDAQKYLHSQISQDILGLTVGAVTWTLVLEPTGKVESLARLTRTGEESFDLDTDAGYGEALAARLRRFKIRVDAEITTTPSVSAEPDAEHEIARVAAGWPRMGFEIVPGETIPAVTGVVSVAVNFTKGCYPGQELVERMDSRGADAPRTLRIVDVDAGAMIGDRVLADDGSEVGVLTSVSPAGGLALALVKRGHDIGRPPRNFAESGR